MRLTFLNGNDMFLKLERHKKDRIDKKYYYIYLSDKDVIDNFIRNFLFLNNINYNLRINKWIYIYPLKGGKNGGR